MQILELKWKICKLGEVGESLEGFKGRSDRPEERTSTLQVLGIPGEQKEKRAVKIFEKIKLKILSGIESY